jgi:hypothetical protein
MIANIHARYCTAYPVDHRQGWEYLKLKREVEAQLNAMGIKWKYRSFYFNLVEIMFDEQDQAIIKLTFDDTRFKRITLDGTEVVVA